MAHRPQERLMLDERFAARRHPGSAAAVTGLALGALWASAWWLPDGLDSEVLLWTWLSLLPVSCVVCLAALVADPRRGPWRWVAVVLARTWVLVWVSLFVVITWSRQQAMSYPSDSPGSGQGWSELAMEVGGTAALVLAASLAIGWGVKALPLHSPRHRSSAPGRDDAQDPQDPVDV